VRDVFQQDSERRTAYGSENTFSRACGKSGNRTEKGRGVSGEGRGGGAAELPRVGGGKRGKKKKKKKKKKMRRANRGGIWKTTTAA